MELHNLAPPFSTTETQDAETGGIGNENTHNTDKSLVKSTRT